MRVAKIILGIALSLIELGAMGLGAYILANDFTWASVGVFVPFFFVGFLIAYTGYDLIRGRSIKDDLFFLFS